MDSSPAAQSGFLVAIESFIRYKSVRTRVVKTTTQGSVKKPYEKPLLRVYGDVRTMTKSSKKANGRTDKRGNKT